MSRLSAPARRASPPPTCSPRRATPASPSSKATPPSAASRGPSSTTATASIWAGTASSRRSRRCSSCGMRSSDPSSSRSRGCRAFSITASTSIIRLRPMNAVMGLGVWNAALIVASYLKWHYRPYPVEENLEQWVTNRFGRRLYLAFFKTYTEKVWGMPCTRDPRRVGRAAHPGALTRARHPQRDVAQQAVDRHQVADSTTSITRGLGRGKCGRPVAI